MRNTTITDTMSVQLARSKKAAADLTEKLTPTVSKEELRDQEDVRIATMVLAAMSHVPAPKDGTNGNDGKDGSNGTNGADGKDGVNGTNGLDGTRGKNGLDGEDGLHGRSGLNGDDGKDGIDGINGKDGIDGKDGINGETGKEGVAGLDGRDGKNGIDGKDGNNGEDGASVYKIKAVDSSYVFTLENGKSISVEMPYVKVAKGADGKSGKDGKQGAAGARGKKGDNGQDGISIDDITVEDTTLNVKLSSGKTKSVQLPVSSFSGSGSTTGKDNFQRAIRVPFDNTAVKLTTKTNVQEVVDELLTNVDAIIRNPALSANPFPAGTAEHFMYTFNIINDSHSAQYVYNSSKQLISTSVIATGGTVLYMIDFTYVTGVLTNKLITDLIVGDNVEAIFSYTNKLLTGKALTYTP